MCFSFWNYALFNDIGSLGVLFVDNVGRGHEQIGWYGQCRQGKAVAWGCVWLPGSLEASQGTHFSLTWSWKANLWSVSSCSHCLRLLSFHSFIFIFIHSFIFFFLSLFRLLYWKAGSCWQNWTFSFYDSVTTNNPSCKMMLSVLTFRDYKPPKQTSNWWAFYVSFLPSELLWLCTTVHVSRNFQFSFCLFEKQFLWWISVFDARCTLEFWWSFGGTAPSAFWHRYTPLDSTSAAKGAGATTEALKGSWSWLLTPNSWLTTYILSSSCPSEVSQEKR